MGGETGSVQQQAGEVPRLPYEQMWRQLRDSLASVDETLRRFMAMDMQGSNKVAAQVHGAEHFSVTGVLGYMSYLEAQGASGSLKPGKT